MGLLVDVALYFFQDISKKHELVILNIVKNMYVYNDIYSFFNLAAHVFYNITSNSHSCSCWSSIAVHLRKQDMFFGNNTEKAKTCVSYSVSYHNIYRSIFSHVYNWSRRSVGKNIQDEGVWKGFYSALVANFNRCKYSRP